MPLSCLSHRLAAAVLIVGGAIGALSGPDAAGAVVPGTNGTIVAAKCEDGSACKIGHIWSVDPISGAQHKLTSGPEYDDDPSVSPDGSRVVFERCPSASNCRIAIMDVTGARQSYVTNGSTTRDDYPSFSPDGKRIAFQRNDAGGNHIELIDADGSNEVPLPGGSASDHTPVFSADGGSIVFERYVSGLGYRIFKAPVNGGAQPTPLTSGKNDNDPSISPDGSHIVFERDSAIWVMDANGGNPHQLSTPPAAGTEDQQPAFSPDGGEIVFERYVSTTTPQTSPLMEMKSDGSGLHAITPKSDYLYKADWQSLHPAPPAGSTPPASPTTTGSSPADTSAPVIVLSGPKRERVRRGELYVFATSNEAVTAIVSGKGAKTVTTTLAAGKRTKIVLRVPRKRLHAIRTALSHGRKLRATIRVLAKDGAGNATAKTLAFRLKR